MRFTLYYQMAYGHTVVVATSDSLLKLCKIKYMTFHNRKGFPYIVDSTKGPSADSLNYSGECLFGANHKERIRFMNNVDAGKYCANYEELIRFMNNVDAGKYYASYDYSQRVRERDLIDYNPFTGKKV